MPEIFLRYSSVHQLNFLKHVTHHGSATKKILLLKCLKNALNDYFTANFGDFKSNSCPYFRVFSIKSTRYHPALPNQAQFDL